MRGKLLKMRRLERMAVFQEPEGSLERRINRLQPKFGAPDQRFRIGCLLLIPCK